LEKLLLGYYLIDFIFDSRNIFAMKPSEIREKFRLPAHIEEKLSFYGEQGVIFLTEPNSSNAAWLWSFFMCFCTLVNVIFLILSSMDGPNNYEGRPDMSTYKSLLTAEVPPPPPHHSSSHPPSLRNID
jgi:hypothetical protein